MKHKYCTLAARELHKIRISIVICYILAGFKS